MHKDKLYLEDILDCIKKIESYVKDMDYNEFSKNQLVYDAVVRNLEIIGEASKKISIEIKKKYPEIEWKKMSGLRDILIHEYSGINKEIIWDVIQTKISVLKSGVRDVLKDLK